MVALVRFLFTCMNERNEMVLKGKTVLENVDYEECFSDGALGYCHLIDSLLVNESSCGKGFIHAGCKLLG